MKAKPKTKVDVLSLILTSQKIYEQNVKATKEAEEVEQNAFHNLQIHERQLFDLLDEEPWYAEIDGITYRVTKNRSNKSAEIEVIKINK